MATWLTVGVERAGSRHGWALVIVPRTLIVPASLFRSASTPLKPWFSVPWKRKPVTDTFGCSAPKLITTSAIGESPPVPMPVTIQARLAGRGGRAAQVGVVVVHAGLRAADPLQAELDVARRGLGQLDGHRAGSVRVEGDRASRGRRGRGAVEAEANETDAARAER